MVGLQIHLHLFQEGHGCRVNIMTWTKSLGPVIRYLLPSKNYTQILLPKYMLPSLLQK